MREGGKAVVAGEGGVAARATVGAGSAAARQRERNDALEGRIKELEGNEAGSTRLGQPLQER